MDARAPGDTTASCTFWFMSADFVRKYPDKKMPFFQELKAKHGHELSEMKMTYAEVVNGTHVEETLSISHRWMNPDDPDPDGEQLKAVKKFLNSPEGRKIKRVWCDAQTMPQGLCSRRRPTA